MINTGDTAFMMICAALVFIMTPGLAFFYGGLVSRKNVLTIMMQSFISMGVVTILWFVIGFSLTFGPDVHGLIGGLKYMFLHGVGMEANPDYGSTIPFMSFFSYQQMFAILTPALITGAFADRVNFKSYLVFLVLGLTVVKPFYASQLHSSDPEIMKFGIEYLSTVMIFSFGLFGQFFFERLLTSTGKTIFSMTSQLCGAITNIILDPILIFGLLGAPKMGVTGAAVATVIGQCVACIVAGTCNHKFNHEVQLSFRGFRPDLKIIGHIYAVGIPSIIMQSISSIMTYCMNLILVQFTVTATAVFGVYFKLQSFFFMPVFGLNNGITPIIAYNYGARHRKRMLKTVKVSMFIAFCFTFIGFLAFEFIPKTLLGLFSASEDMLTIGIPALRIIGIHYLIAWFCIIAGTVFQALGKAVFSMIVSIMRQLFVLIPAAYILASIGGLHAVWWAFPIAEIISLIVSVTFLVVINRTIIQKIPEA